MDKLKTNIQQKLAANVIVDKCSQNNRLVFRDSWCTQERVIRFTTPFFRALFGVKDSDRGIWQSGDFVMYECANDETSFSVNPTNSPYFRGLIIEYSLKSDIADWEPSFLIGRIPVI